MLSAVTDVNDNGCEGVLLLVI